MIISKIVFQEFLSEAESFDKFETEDPTLENSYEIYKYQGRLYKLEFVNNHPICVKENHINCELNEYPDCCYNLVQVETVNDINEDSGEKGDWVVYIERTEMVVIHVSNCTRQEAEDSTYIYMTKEQLIEKKESITNVEAVMSAK